MKVTITRLLMILGMVGLLDMLVQGVTNGEIKIIHMILGMLFGGVVK